MYRWGRFAARRPWRVIGTWLIVSVMVIVAAAGFGKKLEDSFAVPGLDSQQAVDLQQAAQSDRAGLTAQVVVTPLKSDVSLPDSPQAREDLAALEASLNALPRVLGTTTSVSPDGSVALVRVQYPVVEELDPVDLDNLKAAAADAREGSTLQIETGGDLFFAFEESQTGVGEMLGLIAAVIILLLAFGSVIAMGLPIGIALIGLGVSVSALSLVNYLVDIPSFAPVVGAMVGLGVGIDYALFLVTRHREFLARGMTVEESVGRAVATAGQSVIFAGGVVVIAILGLAVSGIPFMTAAGIAVAVVVAVMVAAAVTLLPALLGLAGHRINGLRRRTRLSPRGRVAGAGWHRWGRHVSRHAWVYAIGGAALLIAMAAPALSLRLGFPDEGALPETRTERLAYDLLADGFGPGVNGPLVIAVDTSADPDVVEPLASAIRADPGIASVSPAEVSADGSVSTLVAIPTTEPQDEATFETVERLRTNVFPQVLADGPASAHIGGQTATWGDLGGRVGDRLPLFISAVVLLSFLLLTVVFRSILVPLKAAVMNLLSIGAAYGVLVVVFQWGWGMDLIGLQETVPVIAFIPMFMFAILFGLSMDYEVFLLSRVREEYLHTGDNETSVVRGIASTGRVITSAALIMIAVFFGFILGEDPATKMMGLGLATAIFFDATVVRLILVPATMKLLGDANWWIPGWLDRVMPTIDVDGEAGLPEPAMEATPSSDQAALDTRPSATVLT
jgi:RND superfamily putative drug exporter